MIYECDLETIENALFDPGSKDNKLEKIAQLCDLHEALVQLRGQGFFMLARSLDRIGKLINECLNPEEMDSEVLACILDNFPISLEHAEEILSYDTLPHPVSNAVIKNITGQMGFYEDPKLGILSSIIDHFHSTQNWASLLSFLDTAKDKELFFSSNLAISLHSFLFDNLTDDNNDINEWFRKNESILSITAHRYGGYKMKHAFSYLENGYRDLAREIAKHQARTATQRELIKRQEVFGINLSPREIFDILGNRSISDDVLIHYMLFCEEPCNSLMLDSLTFSAWPNWNNDEIDKVPLERYQQVMSYVVCHARGTHLLFGLLDQALTLRPDVSREFMSDMLVKAAFHYEGSANDLIEWWRICKNVVKPEEAAPLKDVFNFAIELSAPALNYMKLQGLLTDSEGLQQFVDADLLGKVADKSWERLSAATRTFLQQNVPESIAMHSNNLQRARLERDIGL